MAIKRTLLRPFNSALTRLIAYHLSTRHPCGPTYPPSHSLREYVRVGSSNVLAADDK